MYDLPKADLSSLLDLWLETAPGATLPSRKDFRPECELRWWLGDLAIVSVEYAPLRFKAKLIGTRIVGVDDRDITGMYLDEAFPDRDSSEIHKPLEAAVRARQAVRNTIFLDRQLKGSEAAQLVLPLAADGETVDHLLLGFAISGPVRDQANARRLNPRGDIQLLEQVAVGLAWRSKFVYIRRPTSKFG